MQTEEHMLNTVRTGPDSQRARRAASKARGARRDGGDVAVRIPARGAAARRRAPTREELLERLRGRVPVDLPERRPRGVGRAGWAVIVLDASAVIELLLQTATGKRVARRIAARSQGLHAPHLVDVEVLQVLRRWEARAPCPRTERPRPWWTWPSWTCVGTRTTSCRPDMGVEGERHRI